MFNCNYHYSQFNMLKIHLVFSLWLLNNINLIICYIENINVEGRCKESLFWGFYLMVLWASEVIFWLIQERIELSKYRGIKIQLKPQPCFSLAEKPPSQSWWNYPPDDLEWGGKLRLQRQGNRSQSIEFWSMENWDFWTHFWHSSSEFLRNYSRTDPKTFACWPSCRNSSWLELNYCNYCKILTGQVFCVLPVAGTKIIIRPQIKMLARRMPYSSNPLNRRGLLYWRVFLKVLSGVQVKVSSCVGQSGPQKPQGSSQPVPCKIPSLSTSVAHKV